MAIPRRDAVRPETPEPDQAFLDTVCRHLAPRRLVTTELFVRGPSYVDLWLTVGYRPVAGRSPAEVERAIALRLRRALAALDPAVGFADGAGAGAEPRNGWPLGVAVERLALAAEVARADGVEFVTGLRMAAGSGGDTERIPLSGLELPRVLGVLCAPGGDPPDARRGARRRRRTAVRPAADAGPGHAGGLLMRDVNGTSSHVVLRAEEWRALAAAAPAAVWDERRRGLVLLPSVEIFALPAGDRVIRAEDRGCAVALPGGTVVWARHDAADLLVAVPGEVDGERFWPDDPVPQAPPAAGAFAPDPRPPGEPARIRALAASNGRMLAAAVPGGLLVFDLRSGHGPRALRWPPGELDDPRALAADADGSLAVLDGATRKVWRLDRVLQTARIERPPQGAGTFTAESGSPRAPGEVLALDPGVALDAAPDTIALAFTARGGLLSVVQSAAGAPSVVELDTGRSRPPVPLPAPGAVATRLHDVVFLDPAERRRADASAG